VPEEDVTRTVGSPPEKTSKAIPDESTYGAMEERMLSAPQQVVSGPEMKEEV
jgi:hypothetical protein